MRRAVQVTLWAATESILKGVYQRYFRSKVVTYFLPYRQCHPY